MPKLQHNCTEKARTAEDIFIRLEASTLTETLELVIG